jgi:hypothetical protein
MLQYSVRCFGVGEEGAAGYDHMVMYSSGGPISPNPN